MVWPCRRVHEGMGQIVNYGAYCKTCVAGVEEEASAGRPLVSRGEREENRKCGLGAKRVAEADIRASACGRTPDVQCDHLGRPFLASGGHSRTCYAHPLIDHSRHWEPRRSRPVDDAVRWFGLHRLDLQGHIVFQPNRVSPRASAPFLISEIRYGSRLPSGRPLHGRWSGWVAGPTSR